MIGAAFKKNIWRKIVIAVISVALAHLAAAHGSAPVRSRSTIKSYGPWMVMQRFSQMAPRLQWLADGRLQMRMRVHGKPVTQLFDPSTGAITSATQPGSSGGNSNNAKPRVVAPGIFSYSRPIREVPSPDGKLLAGTNNGNLYVRQAMSKHDVWLTHDGTEGNGYSV